MYRIYHANLPRSGERIWGSQNLGKTLSERKVLKAACRRKNAAARRKKDLIGLCEVVFLVRWFKVCRTSKLPAKGTFLVLFACTKSTKSTPEVCEPLDSGDDSKLCRKRLCKNFRRHVPKPVLPAKRRRKGFESVRKGYRSADARLMFLRKWEGVLQAHSSKRYSKRVAAR